ncbi:hypothetical protein LCGC14_1947950 [marine sediment metagenome]|uniref:Uncharacterized protein n=1 Tax=marine sediment metagenome TaxID=412755 RepID=A0A0F9HWL8_9ZZZZ
MYEYKEMLENLHAIGFGIIEFEKDLKEELKEFQIKLIPLYNGALNADCRYSFIVYSVLKEGWEAKYDDWDKKIIIKKKELKEIDGKTD